MQMLLGCAIGVLGWFVLRFIRMGLYTVDQKERAVKTSFGRAARVIALEDPIADSLRVEERDRYCYPQVQLIQPGGPYFKMPWERIHKVSIATVTRASFRRWPGSRHRAAGTATWRPRIVSCAISCPSNVHGR